jgi:hypothetical protein
VVVNALTGYKERPNKNTVAKTVPLNIESLFRTLS